MVSAPANVAASRGHVPAPSPSGVVDPELPMLTLADLGVLRDVDVTDDGTAVATLTPTYVGCPAMNVMRADVVQHLRQAGFEDVEVRTQLDPAWSTDDITPRGRELLREHGIGRPPGPRPADAGPVLVQLGPPPRDVACPNCGAVETDLVLDVRRDRVQGAAPVPDLRRAVRARQAPLTHQAQPNRPSTTVEVACARFGDRTLGAREANRPSTTVGVVDAGFGGARGVRAQGLRSSHDEGMAT